MKRSSFVLTAAVMVIVLAGCSQAQLTELAKDTCAELDGAIVLQVGPILNRAISEADDLGFSGPELGDKMREECPSTMLALDEVGEEQERRAHLRCLHGYELSLWRLGQAKESYDVVEWMLWLNPMDNQCVRMLRFQIRCNYPGLSAFAIRQI